MTDRCGDCKFWNSSHWGEDYHEGQCRRYAPTRWDRGNVAHDYNGPNEALWPKTKGRDWCGEFSARKDTNR